MMTHSFQVVASPDDAILSEVVRAYGRHLRLRSSAAARAYRYFMSPEEFEQLLRPPFMAVVAVDEDRRPIASLSYTRDAEACDCYDPRFLLRMQEKHADVGFVPVGGFVPLVAGREVPDLSVLARSVGLRRFLAAYPSAQTHLFETVGPGELLDEMVLASFPVGLATRRAEALRGGLSVSVGSDMGSEAADRAWRVLLAAFADRQELGSPCPQLPDKEECASYLADRRVLKSVMERNGEMVGVAVLVPTAEVPFIEDGFSADADYFIYDFAVVASERGWETRHLCPPITEQLSPSAVLSFDYSNRLNRLLPLGVARGFGLRRGDIEHRDTMSYRLFTLPSALAR